MTERAASAPSSDPLAGTGTQPSVEVLDRLRRRIQEYETLTAIGQAVFGTLDLDRILERIVDETTALLDASAASIALLAPDGESLEIDATTGAIDWPTGGHLRIDGSMAGRVYRTGRSMLINDVTEEPRADLSYVDGTPLRRALLAPLQAHGKTEGVLTAFAPFSRVPFDEHDREVLERIAAYAAVAIANARLFQRDRRNLRQLRTLSTLASDVAQLRSLDEFFPAVVEMIRSEFGYDYVELFQRDTAAGEVVLKALATNGDPPVDTDYRQSTDIGIVGRVVTTGAAYMARDTRVDPHFFHPPGLSEWQRAELAVPIRAGGETVGVLNVEAREPSAFQESDIDVMQALADLIGVALENARLVDDARKAERQKLHAEKLATIGQLVAGLAHEINNPLAAVQSGAELLVGNPDDVDAEEMLRLIRNEANRASTIVRNLLDFARPHEAESSRIDVLEVLDAALALRAYEHNVQGIRVERNFEPVPPVVADRYRLQQVFINLLVNAEQAMAEQKNARVIEIHTRVVTGDDEVEVRFRDTGSGIEPEHVEKIFDPFFTTKPVGQGTGLGLSVTYGILRELGGRIWVESAAGRGATFTLRLPLAAVGAGTATIAAVGDEGVGTEPKAPKQRATVLFVDDEASIRQVVGRYLSRLGYTVELANDGEAALALLQTRRFDVIITDLKMPGLSGGELYERLKKLRVPLLDRFIFVSGDIVGESTRNFLAATGRPYLAKPFELSKLAEHVRQIALQNG